MRPSPATKWLIERDERIDVDEEVLVGAQHIADGITHERIVRILSRQGQADDLRGGLQVSPGFGVNSSLPVASTRSIGALWMSASVRMTPMRAALSLTSAQVGKTLAEICGAELGIAGQDAAGHDAGVGILAQERVDARVRAVGLALIDVHRRVVVVDRRDAGQAGAAPHRNRVAGLARVARDTRMRFDTPGMYAGCGIDPSGSPCEAES